MFFALQTSANLLIIMDKLKELIAGPVPTLIDFYATWCGPCKAMIPILDELKELAGDSVQIFKADVDAPGNRSLVSHFEIDSVPTIIIFKNGEAVWRDSGVTHAQTLKGVLERV